MRFLIDANLPRSVNAVLRRHGHEATDVHAEKAEREGLVILSADFDFADIRSYPPSRYHGIVVIDRPEDRRSPRSSAWSRRS